MEIKFVSKLVNDDGTELLPYETKKITRLMRQFQDACVIGDNSPINDKAALRMAQVVIENYYIAPRKNEES